MDLGHVGDRHRDAVPLVDHDRRDVGHVVHLALAPDVPRLALVDEIAAADVGVVRPQGVEHVGHRELVRPQLVGVELDLVRLQLAAVRVDLGHAGHAAELVGDEPVEDRPQLHRRHARLLGRLDLELEDLAERRRDRPERRRAVARRDRRGGAAEPLADELPGPVDVGPLVEDDRHHRDPELRDRADLLDVGQAAHRPLDRERQERLDLQRAERRGLGDHLHLHVGQVGHRVDRQVQRRVDAHPRDQERAHDHQEAVSQRRFDEGVQHGRMSRLDGLSIFLGLVLEDQLALEEERAAGDDRLALAQAGGDDLAVARLAAELDRAEGVGMAVLPFPAGRKTPFWFSISTTAAAGTIRSSSLVALSRTIRTNMPSLSMSSGLGVSARIGTVRVVGSTIAPIESSLASKERPG